MPAKTLTSYSDIGVDILSSSVGENSNVILVQTGDSVNDDVHCDNAEWWQQVGFASRPSSAASGSSSCQALALEQSDRDICFASRDTRVASIYGELQPGETALYASGPNATEMGTGRIFLKDDGDIATVSALVQKDNTANGTPVIMQLSSEGKIILNAGENGAISIDQEGVKIVSNSDFQIGSSGNTTVIGQSVALNGANVSLGANATDPIALATQLVTLLAAYQTAFSTLLTALNSGGIITNPASPSYAPLTAALTAVGALTGNISQIPSTSVFAAK